VLVEYDPKTVSYARLLELFFKIHDPTTPNRQGPDVGSQYRSVIFYHSPAQKTAAAKAIDQLETSGKYRRPIVTQVEPAGKFWPAEEYHQLYFQKHPGVVCHF
jgi:peptide-methionine (S)-S-oxide reductase